MFYYCTHIDFVLIFAISPFDKTIEAQFQAVFLMQHSLFLKNTITIIVQIISENLDAIGS